MSNIAGTMSRSHGTCTDSVLSMVICSIAAKVKECPRFLLTGGKASAALQVAGMIPQRGIPGVAVGKPPRRYEDHRAVPSGYDALGGNLTARWTPPGKTPHFNGIREAEPHATHSEAQLRNKKKSHEP